MLAGCWPGKETATLVGGCWPSTETVAVAGGCWPSMELPLSRVLDEHTDMAGSWVDIGQQMRHVCSGWVLISNGDMGVCLLGAGQQRRHGCVLDGC